MNRLLSLLLFCALFLAAPAHAAGNLQVESKPGGATVMVNGVPAGSTPLLLSGLQPGKVDVVVGATGYALWSKTVKVKDGKTAKVKAKLKKPKTLTPEAKAGARAALAQNAALSAEWKSLIRLATGLYGELDFGFGGFGRGPAAAAFYSEAGYYIDVSLAGGFPDLELTADFYLDEGLTEPAGQMTLVTDSLSLVADYSFTAGTYAGSAGHLEGESSGLLDLAVTGSGAFSDGTTWAADLTVSLLDEELAFRGDLDLTYADASTAHWDIEGSITGSDVLISTSSGYALDLHLNPDGSGGGTVMGPDSSTPLAVISWDADGAGTIVYSDGTTETFQLYEW